METGNARRDAMVEAMADHLLQEGLAGASLRPLAAAAGTSDRMLLYYFKTRDALLTATLTHVAARLTRQLDDALPAGERSRFAVLLPKVWDALTSEAIQPFMHLWLDLAAGAARRRQPHQTVAAGIAEGFLAWAGERLEVEPGERLEAQAALFLATVEGLLILKAVGRPGMADRALAAVRPPSTRMDD